MRVGTWFACTLTLATSTATAPAFAQKSPYQANTPPIPTQFFAPLLLLPPQAVAEPPIQLVPAAPPQMAVWIPTAPVQTSIQPPQQPARAFSDNCFGRLVSHILGPSIPDSPDAESDSGIGNPITNPPTATCSQCACQSVARPPVSNENCCCATNPFPPTLPDLSISLFRVNETINAVTRPAARNVVLPRSAATRSVVSSSPQPRAVDNSYRRFSAPTPVMNALPQASVGPEVVTRTATPVHSLNTQSFTTPAIALPQPTVQPIIYQSPK